MREHVRRQKVSERECVCDVWDLSFRLISFYFSLHCSAKFPCCTQSRGTMAEDKSRIEL